MNRTILRKSVPAILFAAILFLLPVAAQAQQLVSTAATVSLTYTVAESISVAVSPTSLTLSTTPQNITVTTTYLVNSTRTAIGEFAYFSSATAALSNGSVHIPSSDILYLTDGGTNANCTNGMYNGASNYGGVFAGLGVAGANCGPVNYNLSFTGGSGTLSDWIQLSINPAASILPGTYTGTLFVVAAVV